MRCCLPGQGKNHETGHSNYGPSPVGETPWASTSQLCNSLYPQELAGAALWDYAPGACPCLSTADSPCICPPQNSEALSSTPADMESGLCLCLFHLVLSALYHNPAINPVRCCQTPHEANFWPDELCELGSQAWLPIITLPWPHQPNQYSRTATGQNSKGQIHDFAYQIKKFGEEIINFCMERWLKELMLFWVFLQLCSLSAIT